jgi:hypothetical protein
MKRSFQVRKYKVIYRIYTFLFLSLAIYTAGFFLFIIFDSAGRVDWSDYWDIAKFILLAMLLLLLVSIIIKAQNKHSG